MHFEIADDFSVDRESWILLRFLDTELHLKLAYAILMEAQLLTFLTMRLLMHMIYNGSDDL